jgi:predicted transposase YdaD
MMLDFLSHETMTEKLTRQLRGTDETFLQLMQLSGAGLLKLAGFAPEMAESFEFRAVEFKEKQLQRPDVEGIPILETVNTRVTLEFQGYSDKYIRYRMLNNMLQICLKSSQDKSVIGIIVYTEKKYQTAAWTLDTLIPEMVTNTSFIKELVLTEYTETELFAADPRLIVLAPFTVSPKLSKAMLQDKVLHWREQLDQIYPATAELSDALNIIGLLLLNRFRNLSHEEIITMLNLDLMQSRAGREIYQMGEIQGKQIGWTEGKQIGWTEGKQIGWTEGKQVGLAEGERLMLKRLLEKRFGKLPRQVQKSLKNATLAELEQWGSALLIATSLDEIFRS